jgi:hypothetical protein
LWFKRQVEWRSGADTGIDLTIFPFKEINHHQTILGYVSKDIALANCYTVFILAIESIQEKLTHM